MNWKRIQRNWKPFKRKIDWLQISHRDVQHSVLAGKKPDRKTCAAFEDNSQHADSDSIPRDPEPSQRPSLILPHKVATVLLVEKEPVVSGLIQAGLSEANDNAFLVERVTQITDALLRLGGGDVDIVMLDITFTRGRDLEPLDHVIRAAPNALIFILAKKGDQDLARQAVQHGAHDYFLKDHIDSRWLSRTLRYIIDGKAIQEALHISEARFRAISDASPLGIFVSDNQGGCIYTNMAYQNISGLSLKQTLGTRWSMAIHPKDRRRVISSWIEAAQNDASFQTEFRFLRKDGTVVWTRVNSAVIHDGIRHRGHVQTVEDITERKSAELELERFEKDLFLEKQRATITLNSIGDAVISSDTFGRVTHLNKTAEVMTGWRNQEAVGLTRTQVLEIIHDETRKPVTPLYGKILNNTKEIEFGENCILVHRNGSESTIETSSVPIHDREGNVSGDVIVFHDVRLSEATTSKMAHQARHDFLTNLPNRAQFTERMSQSIRLAGRHQKKVGLMFLDMNNFKHVNDTQGHIFGDQLLQSVAKRLSDNVRSTDMVCRHGGDEFVILLDEIENPRGADHVAETLISAFTEPHQIDGQEINVTMSIGISIYPEDGETEESLIRNADIAMFHAKAGGKNIYRFYSPDMNLNMTHRLAVQSRLSRALISHEFQLHYQPQIDLLSGAITGAEALIRWQDPEYGLIYPDQFIGIAEDCRLMLEIGRWALHEACVQARAWHVAGLNVVPVAVNISASEFRSVGFTKSIAQTLIETNLPPNLLELEICESVLMHDVESSTAILYELKALGIRLAIDGFGKGYSSFNHLDNFPIDTLKIDRSFMMKITNASRSDNIMGAIINFGLTLNRRVIAEGVETKNQMDYLKSQKCKEGQGFYFCHAVPAEAFKQLLETEPSC